MSYDAFATTFSNSRKNLHWPELEYIIADMKQRGCTSILDVGCGNGRFLDWFGNPPIGGGQGGVNSEVPLFEGGRGKSLPVKDTQGYSHRLPYNRENTERARELRKNMSAPEKELWYNFLKFQFPRWHRQYPIDNFIVDFYCPEIGLIIEIDGENHLEQSGYDNYRTGILEKYGLGIMRFSNRDIMMYFENICEQIELTPPCPPQIRGSSIENLKGGGLSRETLKNYSPLPPSNRGVEHGNPQIETFRYLGIDSSEGMIVEARKIHPDHQFEIVGMQDVGSISNFQLPTSNFDSLLFLASFHHLASREERIQVLQESKKLLQPNGRIYMTNWNLRDQERYDATHRGDGEYDIKIGAYSRYYHGFTVDELAELFTETGYQIIENRVFDGGRNFLSILSI